MDRAKLRDFTPSLSKLGDTDGIVSLMTGEVRRLPQNDIELTDRTIDAIYMPTMENPTHSQIMMTSNSSITKTREKKTFKSSQKVNASSNQTPAVRQMSNLQNKRNHENCPKYSIILK